jgi:hypothetical protein
MKKHLIIAAALTVVSPLLASAPSYADTLFSFSFTDGTNTVTGRVDFLLPSANNAAAQAVYIDSISPLSVSWPTSFPDNLITDSNVSIVGNQFSWTPSGISLAGFLVQNTATGLEFRLNSLVPQYIWTGKTAAGAPSSITSTTITFNPIPTATPLPAALPLFATGIGGLGFLGWRRKRKAQSLA